VPGAKLICIDPRRTETADKCHQHIALRPGTDGALALGLMHELIVHDWLDHDYIEHLGGGLAGAARTGAAVAAAAGGGGLRHHRRRSAGLARDYGRTAPAAIRLNYGMQRVRGGGNAVRLIALLPCLVGAWRHRAGGLLLSAVRAGSSALRDAWLQRPDLLAGRRPRTVNMVTIGDDAAAEAGLAPNFGPRIEALVVYNSNPVAVAPDSAQVVRGFAREDLFTVVLEHFLTDTADHADYVLPATTQLEHWDVHPPTATPGLLLNQPAIAPLGQARSNAADLPRAGRAHGLRRTLLPPTATRRWRARPSARHVDPLARAGLVPSCRWPRRRLPTAASHRQRQGHGRPAGPGRARLRAQPRMCRGHPALAARYPLAMISPPARHFLNSSFVNVASLRAAEREPLLEIHPRTPLRAASPAAPGGACLQRPRRYRCKAEVSERARPGVVNGLGVWWRKIGPDGTNVNEAHAPAAHRHRPRRRRSTTAWSRWPRCEPQGAAARADGGRALIGALLLAAGALCLGSGCSTWATTRRPSAATWTCCSARSRWPTGWPMPAPPARCASACS
jgi:anaerobic selenocysteine-containing dehydrogenase